MHAYSFKPILYQKIIHVVVRFYEFSFDSVTKSLYVSKHNDIMHGIGLTPLMTLACCSLVLFVGIG